MKKADLQKANYFKQKIIENDKWLYRAILALFNKQTSDEKRIGDTKYRNNVGFSGADARLLTYYANYIIRFGQLNEYHKKIARNKILKYSNQLVKISEEKT
jgi:hypothetical protein